MIGHTCQGSAGSPRPNAVIWGLLERVLLLIEFRNQPSSAWDPSSDANGRFDRLLTALVVTTTNKPLRPRMKSEMVVDVDERLFVQIVDFGQFFP